MRRHGHLVMTFRSGESPPGPSHLDVLVGGARATSRLDGGPVDRTLRSNAAGFRAARVFHAAASLGRVGEQHVGFDEVEELAGCSRAYRIELATPESTTRTVTRLRELPAVESVTEQTLATAPLAAAVAAPDPAAALEETRLAHEQVHAAEAHAIEPGDERVTVTPADSGIALGHAEFQRKLLAGYDTVNLGLGRVGDVTLVGDSRGLDFLPRDYVGHGSGVAGIIGAQGWRQPSGVAGRSLMLPVRVLAAATAGGGQLTGVGGAPDIDAGLKVAMDLGAAVVNMSFGTPESSVDPDGPPPHKAVIDYGERRGCVMVAAMGNSGLAERFYPAALDPVIAVGSVDRQGSPSRFSTYGPHVDLVAPGERILTVAPDGYRASSGTSFAAPFVSGAAALVLAHARRRGHDVAAGDVRRILVESVTPLGTGFDVRTGHGLLNVAAAVRRVEQSAVGRSP
ncbi:MAG TPA: S8 family serine peptidase [Thermoleophilaceae bacterium]|jgi:subtilisin family serine protease